MAFSFFKKLLTPQQKQDNVSALTGELTEKVGSNIERNFNQEFSDVVKTKAGKEIGSMEGKVLSSRMVKTGIVGAGLTGIGVIVAGRMIQSHDKNQKGRPYNSTHSIQRNGILG